MTERRKLVLSNSQKSEIIAECNRRDKDGCSWTLADISEWAKRRFSLPDLPHIATVSRILREKEKILLANSTGDGARKRRLVVQYQLLDKAEN